MGLMIWLTHMKTTIEIADGLQEQAREAAAEERTTVRALVEEGLRRVLGERKSHRPFKLRDGSVGGRGPSPEFDGVSWEQIRDAAYRGRGT